MMNIKENEEVCDETCDCHDEETSVLVGDRVYFSPDGGAGVSDAMKELLRKKETLK